jgi:hypothetical protein
MWSWNYIRLPVVSGHPEERRDPILGVYPWFWACFSTVWVVFNLGARGDSPEGWQHKSRRRHFLLTPIRRKLQIDFYVASRLRATDQRIALGRRLQRIE